MAFSLPQLPYACEALKPHIDTKTMEIHHGKHHQTYVDNLNKAIEHTALEHYTIEDLLKKVSQYSKAVRDNGGGHYNHSLFWPMLSPQGGGDPMGELLATIEQNFGSVSRLREVFSQAAKTRFGSGWAWLCVNQQGSLFVCSTPNQDNPLMDVVEESCMGTPIMGLDVWEHAYYLQYQNRRPAYVEAFWNMVNWLEVDKRFQATRL